MSDPIIPTPGSHRPGVVNLRLIGPADVVAAASASLSDFYGGFWQPGAAGPSRKNPDDVLMYGTLIVAVPVTPGAGVDRSPATVTRPTRQRRLPR